MNFQDEREYNKTVEKMRLLLVLLADLGASPLLESKHNNDIVSKTQLVSALLLELPDKFEKINTRQKKPDAVLNIFGFVSKELIQILIILQAKFPDQKAYRYLLADLDRIANGISNPNGNQYIAKNAFLAFSHAAIMCFSITIRVGSQNLAKLWMSIGVTILACAFFAVVYIARRISPKENEAEHVMQLCHAFNNFYTSCINVFKDFHQAPSLADKLNKLRADAALATAAAHTMIADVELAQDLDAQYPAALQVVTSGLQASLRSR